MNKRPSVERIRELLNYNPETGDFTWATKHCRKAVAGAKAGSLAANGYITLSIEGVKAFAHRVAWAYVHGEWPSQVIDHMNGDKSDNRIANLRDVSHSENMQNLRRPHVSGSTGYLGVTTFKGKYQAAIWANGRNKFLGYFDDPKVAHEAYVAAKRQAHAGCTL